LEQRLDEARSAAERSIVVAPSGWDGWLVFGNVCPRAHHESRALVAYSRSLVSQASAEAFGNLASLHYDNLRFSSAGPALQRALSFDCARSDLWYLMGSLQRKLQRYDRAVLALRRALWISPNSVNSRSDLGAAFLEAGDVELAAEQFRLLLSLSPADPRTHNNLGACAQAIGAVQRAMTHYQHALALAPTDETGWYNLSTLLMGMGELGESLRGFERVKRIQPGHAKSMWNGGLVRLSLGEFQRGWADYEWRFDVKPQDRTIDADNTFDATRDVTARVLVWGEQGVGDEVMFGSMLGEFRGWCGKMLVQMDKRLIPLFRRSLPQDVEFYERGSVVSEGLYDSHIPIGSLGLHLRPSRESFEGHRGAYLKADPDRVRALRESFGLVEGERLIGVSWRSSNPETGAGRSLPLWELAQVLGGEGRRLVNLQYGSVQEEIAEAQARCGIRVEQVPDLDCQNDLDGLAALIMVCDEVVSIGNATAHLAGALGQRTTVLLPYSPSWRWMAKGEESPWYQSVRLLRQAERGDWLSVIQAVRHVVDGE
jgi:tetratricopeptide (TPR) repeat protein